MIYARGHRWYGAILVVLLLVTAVAVPTFASQQASPDFTSAAVADAYVVSSEPDLNGGSSTTLLVDASPETVALVRFRVDAGVNVSSAVVSVNVKSRRTGQLDLRVIDDSGWEENSVTYASAPALGSIVASATKGEGRNVRLRFDVSQVITEPGTYSFALTNPSRKRLRVSSRESARAPYLEVITGVSDPTTTSTVPPTTTSTSTTTTTSTTVPPAIGGQPAAPIRAAFMYPWFPNAWDQGGITPFSRFTPSSGMYDSSDPDVIDRQVEQATGAGLEAFINSWWGPGHHTDAATMAVLDRIPQSPNPDFRIAIYYEEEGQSDPSPAAIRDDLVYLERLFDKPSYLRVDGKPVVFVWATGDGASMAKRWRDAKNLYGGGVHVVLKVFSGWRDVAEQPDSWHQYGPSTAYHEHLPWSAVVSPGFWHAKEGSPRLGRDPGRFRNDVEAMAASGAFWQLVTSWNEWGEGTIVEPADEFGTTYLDILTDVLGGGGTSPPVTTTTTSTTTTTTTVPPTTTTTTTVPPTTTTTTTVPPTTTTTTTTTVPPTTTTTTTTTVPPTTTTTTTTTVPPVVGGQPAPPIRGAFMYPWFPNAWKQRGISPFTQFTSSFGLYDSSDPDVIDRQVGQATGAGLEVFINSWWGPGHHTDAATMAVLDRVPQSPNPDFRIAVYYEEEGQSDPSPATIRDDLVYLERLFDKPSYLRIDGKPVVFVWADPGDGAGMAMRWNDAKNLYGADVFVVMKVFVGFRNVVEQPDSWHQYGPSTNYHEHLPHSVVVSPGFWHATEGSPRLVRDPGRFRNDVEAMAASGAFWQLVTSWNEWGEGTIVEPADEFGTTYLDILTDVLGGG